MFGGLNLSTLNPISMLQDNGLLGQERGETTSTSSRAPWAPQQKYLKNLFGEAQGLYNQSQTSPFASLLRQRATSGNPLSNAGMDLATNTLRGDYLNPQSNPFFSGAMSQVMDDAKSKINSQFQGNNYGSSAHQEWLSKGMMGAATPFLANMYQSGLDNQNRVLSMSPSLANQDLELMGMAEDMPWQNLQRFQRSISGDFGGTGTQTTPYYQNNTANTLGALASLGGMAMGRR
jgi:hypothetical protein